MSLARCVWKIYRQRVHRWLTESGAVGTLRRGCDVPRGFNSWAWNSSVTATSFFNDRWQGWGRPHTVDRLIYVGFLGGKNSKYFYGKRFCTGSFSLPLGFLKT